MRYLCKPYSLTLATMIVFFITGCNRKESQQTQPADEIIAQADLAAFPHFTSNHLGEPVLWWAETDTASKSSTVYFAVSKDGGRTFGEGVPIPVAAGFASHSEGMAKLAFKGDGTMILLFQLHRPTEDNYFSSQLMYSQSFDNGQSWTEPKRIHSNSDMNTGHGFADMTIGPDGEAIAVWLDGRNKLDYSEVYFAKTAGEDGFGTDKKIVGPACQCCKPDLDVDVQNRIHITYRAIVGDNIRDIYHAISEDGGETFSEPKVISEDNWQIDACPHNGPSVTENEEGFHFAWFTAGNATGLAYTQYSRADDTFGHREILSEGVAKNMQTYTLRDGRIVVLWDEFVEDQQKIGLVIKTQDGETVTQNWLGVQGAEVSFPNLVQINDDHILLAWGENGNGRSLIMARKINLADLLIQQDLQIKRHNRS